MRPTAHLPPSNDIRRRIEACRDEIAALKRLHRAAQAAEQADAARASRVARTREAPRD
ncbi:MAG TPA: hypothetical protein VMV69_30910 [Pirellulales bacterium]|nr:hypothetical protein [Pirellulales bacterium]